MEFCNLFRTVRVHVPSRRMRVQPYVLKQSCLANSHGARAAARIVEKPYYVIFASCWVCALMQQLIDTSRYYEERHEELSKT